MSESETKTAESKGKKYYYMRFDGDYFISKKIRYLESRENGIYYSNVLHKLYSLGIDNEGFIMDNGAPYDIDYLSFIIGQSPEKVADALEALEKLGFIGRTETGIIYISDFYDHIGTVGKESLRKSEYRARIAAEKAASEELSPACPDVSRSSPDLSRTCPDVSRNCPTEIEIEKETDIKTEKETDKEKESCAGKKTGRGKKAAAFVPPTLNELVDYAVSNSLLSKDDAETCFYYYDSQSWKKANGQKVSDWKGCVRTWSRGESRAGGMRYSKPANPNVIIPSFDYSESEKYTL